MPDPCFSADAHKFPMEDSAGDVCVAPKWVIQNRRAAELVGGLSKVVTRGILNPHTTSTDKLTQALDWVSELSEIMWNFRHRFEAVQREQEAKEHAARGDLTPGV